MSESDEIRQDLKTRIAQLTSKLRSEVSRVNLVHHDNLEVLASECNKAIDELALALDRRLLQAQEAHKDDLARIEEELFYLRELSDSQTLMLQSTIDYIRELEQRFNLDSGWPVSKQ